VHPGPHTLITVELHDDGLRRLHCDGIPR
jgi:hypothetical protein